MVKQAFLSLLEKTLSPRDINILLDSVHDGIWVIDQDGITLHVNKAMERISGLKVQDLVGKHVSEQMHKGQFTTCVTLRALVERRPVTLFDDYANGKHCLNTSTPLFDEAGNIRGVIACIRDLSELNSFEHALTELELERLAYNTNLDTLDIAAENDLIGISGISSRLRADMLKTARTSSTVLIEGETGTGKTLCAKLIHDLSARKAFPLIAVNCGAIPTSLMESELFGYEKGAFTGALPEGKAGMFELANGGTILLDEIADLPLPMQVKLLQVLDEHPFHRVGGTKSVVIDVRVIAATNKNLVELVSLGLFREDLFYRLRVLSLEIPPLRSRSEDVSLLAQHFLRNTCQKNSLTKSFAPAVLQAMAKYPWPGNIRELKSIVQFLASMSEGDQIMMHDLPRYVIKKLSGTEPSTSRHQNLTKAIEELEKTMIMAALAETGSTYKAAQRLGISQSTVVRKAQRHNIQVR